MRELTSAEIEAFDFKGRIPALNVSAPIKQAAFSQPTQRSSRVKMRGFVKSPKRLGGARTA